jgi:hypothetical protein
MGAPSSGSKQHWLGKQARFNFNQVASSMKPHDNLHNVNAVNDAPAVLPTIILLSLIVVVTFQI